MNPHYMLQPQYTTPNASFFENLRNFKPVSSGCFYFYQTCLTPDQLMSFQSQALKSAQIAVNDYRQGLPDLKSEFSLKFENKCEYIPKPTKIEAPQEHYPLNELVPSPPLVFNQQLSQADFKSELKKMVRFLLANMGKDDQTVIQKTRNYYLQNTSLLEIYDKIIMKYYSAKKCKEDIIRCIIRKAFRKIRISIMNQEKVSSKKASLLLCKRYFQSNIQPTGEETEEELLESLMPYKKNSKNRTMNINFVLGIFSSESFCKTYQEFLPELTNIMIDENKKKEEKLIAFLLDCVQKKCVEKLGTVHRMPWTDVWIEDAKNLAIAIMPNKRLIYNSKKPKN